MPKADIEKSFTGHSIEVVKDIEEWRYHAVTYTKVYTYSTQTIY